MEPVLEVPLHLAEEHFLLVRVHRLHRTQDLRLVSRVKGRADQGLHVLREAGAAVSGARVDEAVADAGIRADADPHLLDIGPDPLGDRGELVHEADLGREHGVRGVLGELGGAHIHDDQSVVIANEGLIERAHELGGARVVGADDDPVGFHEVGDRGALFEEFGIRYHVKLHRVATRSERALELGAHLVRRPHRYRGLRDHDAVALHVGRDSARHGEHVAQVRRAVLAGWRAHRN